MQWPISLCKLFIQYSHAALRELHKPDDKERRTEDRKRDQKGDGVWERDGGGRAVGIKKERKGV